MSKQRDLDQSRVITEPINKICEWKATQYHITVFQHNLLHMYL